MKEDTKVKVIERFVLRKYEGDPPFTDDRLLEVRVWQDGKLIDQWHKGDKSPPPTDEPGDTNGTN